MLLSKLQLRRASWLRENRVITLLPLYHDPLSIVEKVETTIRSELVEDRSLGGGNSSGVVPMLGRGG